MKIVTVTHFKYINNYGQRLQNIALVQYLKEIYQTDDVYTFAYEWSNCGQITINDTDIEKKYLKHIP